jgi:hypothetical protein
MGNASVDDTDIAAVMTFFFTTDGKSFVTTFNYSIRNMNKYRRTRYSSIYVFKRPSSTTGRHLIDGVLNMGGSDEGEGGGTGNNAAS